MTGETEEELGHIHCYAGCEKRLSNCWSLPRACSRSAVCAVRCAALSFACRLPSCVWTAPCRRLRRPGDNGVAENMEQNQGVIGVSRALQRHWFCLLCVRACVCVVLLFCLRCKKEYSFQLSYTEAETSESGLAKLMCRKALGVNLKRWVEAVMHMIKVKHAAYTENC